jgi:tetratricopeptide (TPR) repeat protein
MFKICQTSLLSLIVFFILQTAQAQNDTLIVVEEPDTIVWYKVVLNLNDPPVLGKSFWKDNSSCIYRTPEKKDWKAIKRNRSLIKIQPNERNYQKYFRLASSLWECEKSEMAENMFLTIFNSKDNFYTATYHHNSDIPGDTSTNSYGYGSYTSNYKHKAAIYLSKIYIEKQQFKKALYYLDEGVHTYREVYTCGTGYAIQKNEFDCLYAKTYQGLKEYDKIIELLLPDSFEYTNEILIEAIKNKYTSKEIDQELSNAEQKMEFVADTSPSYSYSTRLTKQGEITDTTTYYAGSTKIVVFGKEIMLPVPTLENGERLTKERMVEEYRKSVLYTKLKE